MNATAPTETTPARLFVGLWPDDALRDSLLACAACWRWPPRARRVPRNKLHMTLVFLGAVPRERVEALARGLHVPFDRFELQLQPAEVWPNEVAVLRPLAVPPELDLLHERLHAALAPFELAPAHERWLPHVTLARKARGAVPAPMQAPIRWAVPGYALIESMPSSSYRVVRDYA